jgi:hypothetical protein
MFKGEKMLNYKKYLQEVLRRATDQISCDADVQCYSPRHISFTIWLSPPALPIWTEQKSNEVRKWVEGIV